jgi:hypothetical protein
LQVPREKLVYFPVSSALKEVADSRHSPRHLERSGFIPLLHFLHHTLLKAKEERLARSLLQAAAREAAGIRRRLGEELQILRTESKAELDALEREFQGAKAKFEQWRATDYQRVVGAFQDQSQDLKRATLDRLQNELDTSPTSSPLIGPIIAQLRQSDLSARQLNEQAAAVQSTCIDASTRAIFDIQGDYNQRMQRLIAEASDQLGHTWRAEQSATVRGVSLPPVESLNMQFSGFEDARNALYGGMAGATLAGLAASVIFPLAAPAVFVAGVIGKLVGMFASYRNLEARRKEEALTKLQTLLADTVRGAQRQAMQQFQATATEFERAARTAFEQAASAMQQELQGKLATIDEARTRAREENRSKVAHLGTVVGQADTLLRTIG